MFYELSIINALTKYLFDYFKIAEVPLRITPIIVDRQQWIQKSRLLMLFFIVRVIIILGTDSIKCIISYQILTELSLQDLRASFGLIQKGP